ANGTQLGVLTQVTIDRQGIAQLVFSNGDTVAGQRLALASFADPQSLAEVGASSFEVISDAAIDQPQFGFATEGGLGQLRSSNIELANVNLSQEFSNIIVLQRAFQGSSQVLNVSSQLLEQLYNNLAAR
ncbi:MAG: flagellar hook-basal body complex protein, partial [Nevskia sp.]|nr:flagellar hook-basal body complex protein [Nevskia sp.]